MHRIQHLQNHRFGDFEVLKMSGRLNRISHGVGRKPAVGGGDVLFGLFPRLPERE